jgi:tripartite-type tricarboxylate transporter receptor subunit TctC
VWRASSRERNPRFLSLGVEPTGTTPEALAAIMAADTARWAPIIKASGFTADQFDKAGHAL